MTVLRILADYEVLGGAFFGGRKGCPARREPDNLRRGTGIITMFSHVAAPAALSLPAAQPNAPWRWIA